MSEFKSKIAKVDSSSESPQDAGSSEDCDSEPKSQPEDGTKEMPTQQPVSPDQKETSSTSDTVPQESNAKADAVAPDEASPPAPATASPQAASSSSSSSIPPSGGAASHAWDPEMQPGAAPTKSCLMRLRSDMKELIKNPLQGIYCFPDEEIATKFHALIVGPFDTPYEGGFFYFVLVCPENYPSEPPRVKLMTTGGGTVRFNPNLYANGKVCLSILGTWSGPSWSPVQTLMSVLLSIQTLMSEKPYHNEPGFEAPNSHASNQYNDCIRHESIRIAVCETLSESSSLAQMMPAALRDVAISLFPGFIDSYELTCMTHQSRDGQKMIDPFGEKRGQFNYTGLLDKLAELKEKYGEVELSDDDDDDDGEG